MLSKFNLKTLLSLLAVSLTLPMIHQAGAMDTPLQERKFPSKFAVYQQTGATCPFICWDNLKKVREMRRGENDSIQFEEADYVTKIHSYAWFLPRIRTYDRAHSILRSQGGSYALYEHDLRSNGIKSKGRFNEEGKKIKEIDWNPLDTARRIAYTPYNIKVSKSCDMRYVPVLVHGEEKYVYDFTTKSARPLSKYQNEDLWERGFLKEELLYPDTRNPKFESEESYYVFSATDDWNYSRETFYYLGTFQHILFACGLDKDNEVMTADSPDFLAYKEFHDITCTNPLNPWSEINKDDLFEYHLTEIFKGNNTLKNKAMKSLNYYNNCWTYYRESFDFYDGPNPKEANKLSDKQRYMPGENQALAYFFSSQLRFLWAASISTDAVVAISEIEEDLGGTSASLLKNLSFLPFMPSAENIVKAATEKKYSDQETSFWNSMFDQNKYSFLDTWNEIKPILLQRLDGKKDLATFYEHGCVISFDLDLIKLQKHEFPEIAKQLGFEMWESLYDKGIKPFYQKQGTPDDVIHYEK